MRILLIHNFYQHRGGEDTVVQQEAEQLSKGNLIKTITTKNSTGLKGLCQFLLYPFNIWKAKQIMKDVLAFKPDIVHIHNVHYALGPWIIHTLKKKGIPVVMTLHNFRLICPSATLFLKDRLFTNSLNEDFPWTAVKDKVLDNSFIKTFVTAFVYWWHKKIGTWSQIDQFLVLSEFSKNIFIQSKLGLTENYFVVKPNFATVNQLNEKKFENFFLYIGRLSPEKGILQLLEAVTKTSYPLKIFGTGPLEKEVVQIVQDHPNIEFLGFQSSDILRQNMEKASALVVPSVCYEGMPMTILEAYGLGTPVLSSNIGILQEMVVPLYTGLHFDPYSSNSIQETLTQWIDLSSQEKEIMSKNCITIYTEKYTATKNIDLLLKIYKTAIDHNANKQ
ncbi:Glycosyltransferase involved in cell wall bisynthesis [Sphingobacterium nematocida]|uniref:Glycosyltransferase involved in cell wall bisynthesis n=1 Tax=Sphingobacterium nematocida TaxID=1513896 RepID=A0A1T5BDI5_9SPHI|nr:glycosyltransferase family 4 protein [Sphingobacterium nematocida]SKB44903.1 Glycosyltransferase involved in cell wall bisynthesis [Sphingobacterium nematocida]